MVHCLTFAGTVADRQPAAERALGLAVVVGVALGAVRARPDARVVALLARVDLRHQHVAQFQRHLGAVDALLGGGLERGTSALLVGAAGVGKSSIAVTYAVSAARRGERVAMYAFDEGLGTL